MDAIELINTKYWAATDYDNDDRAVEDLVHAMKRGESDEVLQWVAEHALTIAQARAGIAAFYEFQTIRPA